MSFQFTTNGPTKDILFRAFGAFDAENIIKLNLPPNLSTANAQKIRNFLGTSLLPEQIDYHLSNLARKDKTGQNFFAEGTINGKWVTARFNTRCEIATLIFKID